MIILEQRFEIISKALISLESILFISGFGNAAVLWIHTHTHTEEKREAERERHMLYYRLEILYVEIDIDRYR